MNEDALTSNIDVVADEWEAMVRRSEHRRDAFDAMHRLFMARRHYDFISQGATTASGAWAKLKPETIRAKIKRLGRARSILVATGRLLDSLMQANHSEHFYVANDTEILGMGTKVPYARALQEGARPRSGRKVGRKPRPTTGLPPRPFIDPTQDEFDAYAEILGTWIVDGVALGEPRR